MWNATTLALLHRYRMLMVLWTVDTNDYRLPGVPAIVEAAVDGARPGAIILLHDAGGDRSETVAALPKIIRELRRARLQVRHRARAAARQPGAARPGLPRRGRSRAGEGRGR